MWTVSAFQQHGNTMIICDEDATLEPRVRTVKYFKVGLSAYTNNEINSEKKITEPLRDF